DVLDDLLVRGPATGDSRLEGIEVADDKVDGLDAVSVQGGDVLGIVADGEDAAVDARMQRLDAAVEHLRKASHVGNVAHRQAGVGQRLARAAGGDQLDVEGDQAAREVEQAGLVADAEQGAANGTEGHGLVLPCKGTSSFGGRQGIPIVAVEICPDAHASFRFIYSLHEVAGEPEGGCRVLCPRVYRGGQ